MNILIRVFTTIQIERSQFLYLCQPRDWFVCHKEKQNVTKCDITRYPFILCLITCTCVKNLQATLSNKTNFETTWAGSLAKLCTVALNANVSFLTHLVDSSVDNGLNTSTPTYSALEAYLCSWRHPAIPWQHLCCLFRKRKPCCAETYVWNKTLAGNMHRKKMVCTIVVDQRLMLRLGGGGGGGRGMILLAYMPKRKLKRKESFKLRAGLHYH